MPGPVAAERVGVRPELAREVERDALHRHGQGEDGELLGQLVVVDGEDVGAEPARGAGDLEHALGARAAPVQRDEPVAGTQRHARPVQQLLRREALGRDVGGLARLERALRRGPGIGSRAGELEQAGRRAYGRRRHRQRGRHRIGNALEFGQLGAEGTRQLRHAHERAEVARGEGRTALRCDRLDVAARADARDHHGADLAAAGLVARRRRVALGVAVGEQDQRVARGRRRASERGGERLDRPRLTARRAQQVGAVVRGMEARAGTCEQDAPGAADAVGGSLDRSRVSEDACELGRLRGHALVIGRGLVGHAQTD